MADRHYGISTETQRKLFAVHLNKTTDRPVYRHPPGAIAAALAGWAVIGLLFYLAWLVIP